MIKCYRQDKGIVPWRICATYLPFSKILEDRMGNKMENTQRHKILGGRVFCILFSILSSKMKHFTYFSFVHYVIRGNILRRISMGKQ